MISPLAHKVLKSLRMPTPNPRGVCSVENSALREWAGKCWYAATALTCPSEELILVSDGDGQDVAGDPDSFALEMIATDEPEMRRFAVNLETGWTKKRDELFAISAKRILDLRMADYQKHMVGVTDSQRENASRYGNSQLLICFDELVQNAVCDEVVSQFVSHNVSEECRLCFKSTDFRDFLLQWDSLFKNGVRIPAKMGSTIGYEKRAEIKTFFIEVNLVAGYHMYPATLSPQQELDAIYCDS